MSDAERTVGDDPAAIFKNAIVGTLVWEGATVAVKDRRSKESKDILCHVKGVVKAGELLAITDHRECRTSSETVRIRADGSTAVWPLDTAEHTRASGTYPRMQSSERASSPIVRPPIRASSASAYVEQEDALVGSLTVRETLEFAARLALPTFIGVSERRKRVDNLLEDFGLTGQANNLIGISTRKGR